jgi:soluble lytic murein transglycosylase-like protein
LRIAALQRVSYENFSCRTCRHADPAAGAGKACIFGGAAVIAWFRDFVFWLDSFFPRPAPPAQLAMVPPEPPKIEPAPPGAAQDTPKVSGMIPLLPSESAALDALANSLGVNSKDLFVLINFESGWSPSARNPVTGARGLIQFMPDTAQGLGYRDADDLVARFPSREAQLNGPVRA